MSLMSRLMTRNVGTIDRIIRTLPALVFAYVWATGSLAGIALIVFGVISAMLLFTAITSRCSIYAMLGFNTCPHQKF
jgi:Protein of unknown function (DUF2892)